MAYTQPEQIRSIAISQFMEDILPKFEWEEKYKLRDTLETANYDDNVIVESIFSYLDLIPENKDRYVWFANFIKEAYGINKNILKICGGHIPALALHIDRLQRRSGQGRITVYDPRIVLNELGNITLIKENFTREVSIEDYDLIVSMRPCSLTSMIFEQANLNKKPFAVMQCECYYNGNYYLEAQRTAPENMTIQQIQLPYCYDYCMPVIYSKKRN